ncbi:MAG: hypothetical protein HYX83_04525 [Chloroflexi bacterium]|nr:hypothetical protein [Chloroflexota bacterium]
MSEADEVLLQDADGLARRLFGGNMKKRIALTSQLLDICRRARGQDFLIIHNPGGWGCDPLNELLAWERSIVDGVMATIERMGHGYVLMQYFRSGRSFWTRIRNMKEEARLAFKGQSQMARLMAAELEFITKHFPNLKIIMVGVSQGAAFSNTVMRQIADLPRVYSIELGIVFFHLSRRVITARTLAIDGNGVVPDPITHRNLKIGLKAYITAPSRWVKYRLEGKPRKFTYCINAPGHDYNWEYPGVSHKIEDFLKSKFGVKDKLEVGSK